MIKKYPVILSKDVSNVIVEFPDVPEAITVGSNVKEALEWAEDALIMAFTDYLDDKRKIPEPSKIKPGQKYVLCDFDLL